MKTAFPSRSIPLGPCLALIAGLAAGGPVAAAQPGHYLITDYGAIADGTTLNTSAIQKAIDAAAAAGGGVAEIPGGRFLSGSIFLKKGVELHLDDGAVLLGSQNIGDYPKEQTRIEGHFQAWRMALVNAQEMDHVRIGGSGQLNGNGAPFWALFRARIRADRTTTNLDVERPRLVFIDRCSDVRVEGISLQDSGFWNLHLYHCRDVAITGVRINAPDRTQANPIGSPSTDGIDVDSCQNVTIRDCNISDGDDDIALKGSKGPLADKDADSPPDENILIENCEFGTGSGVLTCGSEATIVRNVTVRNCKLTGRGSVLRLKLRQDTPQHYTNITIDGITATDAGRLLEVSPWMQYFDLKGQPPPKRVVDQIVIRNVTGKFGQIGSLRGTAGDSIGEVSLENIDATVANPTFSLGPVKNMTLKNVVVNGRPYELPPAQEPIPVPAAR
ncbi:MAG: glycosyl hydrolase family 28 protein [Opitutaceae bacterium]